MDVRQAFRLGIEMGEFVSLRYIEDLTDAELLHRPAPGANHINWQVGHLIASEHQMLEQIRPDAMPPLPAGFAERYSKETASSDNPQQFLKKDELLAAYRAQRQATLDELERTADADFDLHTGVNYAPTVGSMFSLQGSHWLMHAGQWAIVRRQLGRPPLF